MDIEKFAYDTLLEEQVRGVCRDYSIKNIVETGTWIGGTTQALSTMAEHVYTIEINKEFYDTAKTNLNRYSNITQYLGSSVNILPYIFPLLNYPTFFYLDAHWGGTPLLTEIDLIAKAVPNPVIMIHDFQVPNRPELKWDNYNCQPYCFEWIKPHLDNIKTPWRHFYNSEATGCKVGVIFIVPK